MDRLIMSQNDRQAVSRHDHPPVPHWSRVGAAPGELALSLLGFQFTFNPVRSTLS
jgi:hypothetical protein